MTESAELRAASTPVLPAQTASAASAVPPSLDVGSHVGSFQLRELIAEGPSTAVYLAQDSSLGVDVAIKEFRLARGASRRSADGVTSHVELEPAVERGLRAFVEEARMLARCVHPSLLSVRGLFESQGTAYRVMPHYSATGLIELRASMPRPPDEPSVRAVLNHLLGALEALHANGHVHGALVASNVLLLPDDRPLLMGPGSAAREAAYSRAHSQLGGAATAFADAVSEELRHLADLAEFCITGVQRVEGQVREPADTVTAAIVRELGAVELRHYSAAFLSVLDVASSAAQDNRPLNTAQFATWLGSHEVRRLKQPLHSPGSAAALQALTPPAQSPAPDHQAEWANTVPPAQFRESLPAFLSDAPASASRVAVGRKSSAQADDFVSSSQIWADTVQVLEESPSPTKRATVYPPQPMPQVRPNFEQRRWQARKWAAGLGTLGVGLMAALFYVTSGPKDSAPRGAAAPVPSASTVAAVASLAGPAATPAAAIVRPPRPAALPTAGAATDMPEIRLPVAERYSPSGAASAADAAASVAAPLSSPTAVAAAATAGVAGVAGAAGMAGVAGAAGMAAAPASGKRPKGLKISRAAWANGPRAVCSANASANLNGSASAASCLKTQCRRSKWLAHPQCARTVVAKTAG